MRQAFYNVGVLRDDQGNFVGFSLGSDHCAEHEWGIRSIARHFGLDNEGIGVPARTVTRLPSTLSLVNGRGRRSIVYSPYDDSVEDAPRKYKLHKDMDIVSAWDEASFVITVSKKLYAEIDELWSAFHRKDAAIWIGGGNPFGGHGLVLAIVSKIPGDKAKAMYDCDSERKSLLEYMEQSGIKDKLYAAGRRFMVLKPSKIVNSETGEEEIKFWLNPEDQRSNKCGWFTLAELEEWANGEGPIPIKGNR